MGTEYAPIRLQLISDLHTEHHGIAFAPTADELDAGADIVVFAGDIASAHDACHVARRLSVAPQIIVVAGNHEFYRGGYNIDDGVAHMRVEAERLSEPGSQLHALENDVVIINIRGQAIRILGCTLWTDFELFGTPEESGRAVTAGLNDFRLIRGTDGETFSADECISRHLTSRRFLEDALARPFDGPTIVVTHHLPSMRSVSPRYAEDPLSPGFASRCDDLLKAGAALWVHGHTHYSVEFRDAGGTLVVCNPAGYVYSSDGWQNRENQHFDPRLTFTISSTEGRWRAEREDAWR